MKIWLPILCLLVLVLGAGIILLKTPAKPAPEKPIPRTTADLTALKTQLQEAAEKALPAPSLGGWTLELKVKPAELDARLEALKKLAESYDGSAIRDLDRDGAAVLLVNLPESAVAAFNLAARGGIPPLPSAESPEKSDGTVILQPLP